MLRYTYSSPCEMGLSHDFTASIDKTLAEDLDSGLISCAAASVMCKNKLVYRNFVGNASSNIPLNEKHLFRMASMTKPVTGVCVMRQIENGKLALTDSITKYIPALSDLTVGEFDSDGNLIGSHSSPRHITVEDLLTHSSGLGSGTLFDTQFMPNHTILPTIGEMAPVWKDCFLAFDPGTAAYYSWLVAFDLLAHIVELTSDMAFEEYAKAYLFNPLEMTDTCFTPNDDQWSRIVQICATENGKAVPVNMGNSVFANFPRTYHSGGGGLISSLDDYTRFAHMLLSDGISFGTRILKEETVKVMRTPHLPPMLPGTDSGFTWGYSMRIVTADNDSQAPLTKGCYGWSGAYGTHFWCDPVRQISAVYLSNMTTAGGSGALTARHMEHAVMNNLGNLT